ncbi:TPA: hypothetical protein P2I16_000155, partial [Aeromonas salmonicida]|nr:hypothetical protein [Aeromonas salmonicida]
GRYKVVVMALAGAELAGVMGWLVYPRLQVPRLQREGMAEVEAALVVRLAGRRVKLGLILSLVTRGQDLLLPCLAAQGLWLSGELSDEY